MQQRTGHTTLVLIALATGFALGMLYQQRADEHRLIMAEWKKVTSMNQLIDAKLSNEIDKTRKERKDGKLN